MTRKSFIGNKAELTTAVLVFFAAYIFAQTAYADRRCDPTTSSAASNGLNINSGGLASAPSIGLSVLNTVKAGIGRSGR
jgi:hypothetical protein